MTVKCSLVIIGMLILVFIVLLYINNKVKKHKQRTKRIFSLVIVSILIFLFILQIVFIALLSAPANLVELFPFLFCVNEQSFGWISIWLAVFDIILSSITAIVAIIISLRQDDLTQLEFRNSLIPRIKRNGFKARSLKKSDFFWPLACQQLSIKQNKEKGFENNIYLLDFQLLEELNIGVKYEINKLKVYKGFVGINKLDKNCLICSDKDQVRIFLSQKQKYDSWFLEILFGFEAKSRFSEDANKFLSVICSGGVTKDESEYTLALELTLQPYCDKDSRNLLMMIQLLNEAAATGNMNKKPYFSVYAVENKFI